MTGLNLAPNCLNRLEHMQEKEVKFGLGTRPLACEIKVQDRAVIFHCHQDNELIPIRFGMTPTL